MAPIWKPLGPVGPVGSRKNKTVLESQQQGAYPKRSLMALRWQETSKKRGGISDLEFERGIPCTSTSNHVHGKVYAGYTLSE